MTAKREKTLSEFVVVWEFCVRPDQQRTFEKAYASDGIWATFFRSGDGYVGTELIRDREEPLRYLTIDVWQSRQAYELFKKKNRAEYQAIDQRCESLTRTEKLIGEFQSVEQRARRSRKKKH